MKDRWETRWRAAGAELKARSERSPATARHQRGLTSRRGSSRFRSRTRTVPRTQPRRTAARSSRRPGRLRRRPPCPRSSRAGTSQRRATRSSTRCPAVERRIDRRLQAGGSPRALSTDDGREDRPDRSPDRRPAEIETSPMVPTWTSSLRRECTARRRAEPTVETCTREPRGDRPNRGAHGTSRPARSNRSRPCRK